MNGSVAIDLAQRHGQVHGDIGRLEVVRRPVVAIHAVHPPDLGCIDFVLEVRRAEFGDHSLLISHAHPGDGLARFVAGDVFDLVADVHVPVNAAHRSVRRIAAAHLHQQPHCIRCVRFVGEIMLIDALEIADEFLRPVALLAGFLGGAQVLDRRLDWARKFVERDRVHLVGAADLRFHIPGRAGPNVTFCASHPRVRRVLVGRQLRAHDGVARLAAELHRLGYLISPITAESAQKQESNASSDEKDQNPAVARP